MLIIITYLRRVQEVVGGGNGYFVEDECLVVAGIESLVLRLGLLTIPHEVDCIHTYTYIRFTKKERIDTSMHCLTRNIRVAETVGIGGRNILALIYVNSSLRNIDITVVMYVCIYIFLSMNEKMYVCMNK